MSCVAQSGQSQRRVRQHLDGAVVQDAHGRRTREGVQLGQVRQLVVCVPDVVLQKDWARSRSPSALAHRPARGFEGRWGRVLCRSAAPSHSPPQLFVTVAAPRAPCTPRMRRCKDPRQARSSHSAGGPNGRRPGFLAGSRRNKTCGRFKLTHLSVCNGCYGPASLKRHLRGLLVLLDLALLLALPCALQRPPSVDVQCRYSHMPRLNRTGASSERPPHAFPHNSRASQPRHDERAERD